MVTNLSTSLVVDDAAREGGAAVERAPVGEANVVERMAQRGAVVGGEGNGGVILPEVHLGRDAPGGRHARPGAAGGARHDGLGRRELRAALYYC